VKRAWTVYSVYGARGDAFEQTRAVLPADANPLGMVTRDGPKASLWQPFGSRRILHVCRDDTPEETRRRGIHYVLVSSFVLSQSWNMSLDEWLARNNAEVVQRLSTFGITGGQRRHRLVSGQTAPVMVESNRP
jgi:hypothetical protein